MTPVSAQEGLVAALCAGLPGPVTHLQTHISHVLITPQRTWKLKKPVNFGFLDFSTLEQRHAACLEELRVNRRTAPDLYLGVVAVTGTPQQPQWEGSGPVLDYAVAMRTLPPASFWEWRLAHGGIGPADIDALADTLAAFHARCAVAGREDGWGQPAAVLGPAIDNFAPLRAVLPEGALRERCLRLYDWTVERGAALRESFLRRLERGRVRECHGDLHLGNIASTADGAPLLFDAIEISPALRWCDVLSELAFTVMDLQQRGYPHWGWRLLNRYLETSGDHDGLDVLPFYQVYRALVRAKVSSLQSSADLTATLDACFGGCERLVFAAAPVLHVTCGLSGSGKSVWSRRLAERSGLILLRSDVERKRMAGLPVTADSASLPGQGLYTPQHSRAVYDRLAGLAGRALAAGFGVVVDAACLQREQRDRFRALAHRAGVRLQLWHMEATPDRLRERVLARQGRGDDASEAGPAVLEAQLLAWRGFDADETDVCPLAPDSEPL